MDIAMPGGKDGIDATEEITSETEALYSRLQKGKERKIIAKLREQETKIENFDPLLLEYLGLIALVILQDASLKTPMSKKDLMKELQRKSCIPVDSATLHFSLDGLERSGIIKRGEGFLSEDGLFFYLNLKEIKVKGIYGTFLAKRSYLQVP